MTDTPPTYPLRACTRAHDHTILITEASGDDLGMCPAIPDPEDTSGAYARGYNTGRTDGYDDGLRNGRRQGRTDGYEQGKIDGYQVGKAETERSNYLRGYEDAQKLGQDLYERGLQDGRKDASFANNDAYARGYTDGNGRKDTLNAAHRALDELADQ